MSGVKHDQGKRKWDLLPLEPIEEIIDVLQFGADKYEIDNWKIVDNKKSRYYNAAMRHLVLWKKGYKNDGDESGNLKQELIDKKDKSGMSHLAHAACCILFLLWDDKNTEKINQ